ncbi:uncharacterized protein LOC116259805 isoform X2 [Nymphaea colorata]|nr:uncharacterized protein LOC116259805 isoform X2 [Nymphaea colorata]XP_049935744.1 uncharacterized protein LOC116259805 isoform X2 [Nymphaea colorata]
MPLPGQGVTKGCRKRFLFVPLLLLPFLFSAQIQVQKFHESQNVVDGSKHPVKKFDHLVFGPAAGRGFPGRVQCDGFKAISKVPSLHSPRFLKFQESISIVTFFVAYNNTLLRKNKPEKFLEKVTVGNTSYDKAGRSLAILNVFINFIQVSMPQSNVIILTDPASDLSYNRNDVSVFPIHGNYSRENLMLQRIKAYIAFLGAKLDEIDGQKRISHFVFTDSDVAIVDDLRCIFENYPQFHLALTFRNNKNQPLNSGVIAVRGTREGILKAKTFLEEVLRIYVSKFSKASYMLGDQLSLAWVVRDHAAFNSKRFTKSEAFVDEINGAFVLFLPCLVYNWTPPEGAGQFHGMPVDVKIIHFKGSRKRLMLESWNFFNSSSPVDFSDMMCLILKSGRTKVRERGCKRRLEKEVVTEAVTEQGHHA